MKWFLQCAAVFMCVLLLGGCASFADLDAGLNSLGGSTEAELFAALGYPDGQQKIDEETTIYFWRNQRSGSYVAPQVQNTYGTFGNTPFNMQTTSYQTQHYDYQCNIKYVVKNGRAYHYEYMGTLGGCEPYIFRLEDYIGKNKAQISNYTVPPYTKCIEEEAVKYAELEKNMHQLANIIEKVCKERTGETGNHTRGLALFQAQLIMSQGFRMNENN